MGYGSMKMGTARMGKESKNLRSEMGWNQFMIAKCICETMEAGDGFFPHSVNPFTYLYGIDCLSSSRFLRVSELKKLNL